MAASAYFDAVQKLYIAYYGRPADTVGLNYWAEQIDAKKGDIQAVVNAFGSSAEAQAIYGSVDTVVQVNNLFKNILGREADVGGLNFYASNVANGKYTLASLAQRILDGATTGDDAKVVANKLAAAKAFTAAIDTTAEVVAYTGDASAQQAREFLKAVTADTATVPDAAKAQAAVTGLAGVQTPEQTFQLTSGADKKTANVFEAAQVYTPGGNDRINSLQNDDVLTGTGANPTLNVVLGNTGDNGATVITPTLKAIETINARFDATNANMTLDLQDASGVKAVNVTRVAEGQNATVQNIADKVEKLSVANSQSPNNNITFTFLGDALKGAADSVELKLSNVNTNTLRVEERATAAEGFETINLVSTGASNKVATLQAEDLKTLNISGDKDLTLGATSATNQGTNLEATRYASGLANVAGSLTAIDASTLTGNLDITLSGEFSAGLEGTSGKSVQLSVKGGKGDDTFRLMDATVAGSASDTDTIAGGEGTNKVVVLGNTTIAAATAATITNVQKLEVRSGHDTGNGADTVSIDAKAFDKLAEVFVRNEGQTANESTAEALNLTLKNLSDAQAQAITVAHGTTGNSGMANNNVTIEYVTNSDANAAKVTLVDGVNTNPVFNLNLTATSAEKVTLVDSDTESNTVNLGNKSFTQKDSTLTIDAGTDSDAGKYFNLDSFGATSQAAAADRGYGFDTTGAAGDATTVVAATAKTTGVADAVVGQRDAAVSKVFVGIEGTAADTANRLAFENIVATGYEGDLVVRLGDLTRADGTTSMNIQSGKGNDTFIFDAIGSVTAGFTSGDTIKAGEGRDTLVLDGNTATIAGTPRINHQTSEWDNLSGIDVLRFGNNKGVTNVGNGAQVQNAGGAYYARIDNDFVTQTDAKNRLVIENNDGILNQNTESDVVIDVRGLSQDKWITFVGANGVGEAGISSNRIVLDDVSANQNQILNGGDTDVRKSDTAGYVTGNNNVYEVRNTANVSVSDLSQAKNFGRIEFTNDAATTQTLTLTVNNAIVEALVDESNTASQTKSEVLKVQAYDNANLGTSLSALNVDARQVDGYRALDITGTGADDVVYLNANVGGASHTVNLGAGTDRLNWSGAVTNSIDINLAAGTHTFVSGAVTTNHTVTAGTIETVDISAVTGYTSATLAGGAGAQTIIGGVGADTITGGAGADTMTGGQGTNTFRFAAAADVTAGTPDTITDFDASATNILSFNGAAGPAFALVGGNTISHAEVAQNAFAATNNVVVITTAVVGALTAANAATAIGSATGNYANGDGVIFVVSNNTDSAVFKFTSAAADATVTAAELGAGPIITLTGVNTAELVATTAANFALSA